MESENTVTSYSLVKLPTSSDIPMEQLHMPADSSLSHEGQMLTFVEPHFALREGESVDMKLIEEQVAPAMEIGCVGGMCPHISFTSLRKHAEEGNPEVVTIRFNENDKNDATHYRLYYDDAARLKRRPLNTRANEFIRMSTNSKKNQSTTEPSDESTGLIYGDVLIFQLGNGKLLPLSPKDVEEKMASYK